MSSFTLEAYQNEYLPLGGTAVNAIVTVTSDGSSRPAGPPESAVIVIIDASGSMGSPSRKIKAARGPQASQSTASGTACRSG